MSDDDPVEETHRSLQQLGMAISQGTQLGAQAYERKVRQRAEQAATGEAEAGRQTGRETTDGRRPGPEPGPTPSPQDDDPRVAALIEHLQTRPGTARGGMTPDERDASAADHAYAGVNPTPTSRTDRTTGLSASDVAREREAGRGR